MKYDTKETKEIIDEYQKGKNKAERDKIVQQLAKKYNNSIHSIRAKLAAEGVYICELRKSKITGGRPKSKETMVDEMEREFNFTIGQLEGLERAPKLVLVAIYEKLKDLKKLS